MNQQEVEAWIAQQGGPKAVQYSSEKRRIPNPAYSLTLANGEPNPQYQPGQPPTVESAAEQWVNSKTGAKLSVSRKDDGSFDVIENTTADPNKPGSANTPQAQNEAELQRQRVANAALPGPNPNGKTEEERRGQDPAYETDEERRKRADARIKEQGAAATAADAKARQDRLDAEASSTRASQESRAAAAANKADSKTETITGSDGKPYTRVTIVSADGKNVDVHNFGPDGKPVGEIPGASKTGFAAEPEGAPQIDPKADQRALIAGVQTYSSWLNQQVQINKDDPTHKAGITPDDATKLMNRRADYVESLLKQGAADATAASGVRGQDITQRGQTLADTQNRRSASETAIRQTDAALNPLLAHLSPSSAHAFIGAQQERMNNALGYAGQWGGMRESPEIGASGILAQYRQQAQQGIQTAANGGPQIFAPRPLTAPAGGAPLLPPQPMATAPANPGAAEAAAQASIEQANAGRAPLPAPAPVGAPSVAPPVPVAQNPIDASPIVAPGYAPPPLDNVPNPPADAAGVPSVYPDMTNPLPSPSPTPPPDPRDTGVQQGPTMNGMPDNTHTWARPPGGFEPGSPEFAPLPNPGDPTSLPGMPTVPYPSNAGAESMAPPPMRAVQQARYGQSWDSEAAAAELAQRLGIDPEIMKQAHAGLYG